MGFNFDAAIREATDSATDSLVSAIILGPGGAGKSSIMGTFGCKTLFLYTSGESHGPASAKKQSLETHEVNNIIPVRIDLQKGVELTPDQAYMNLLELLSDVEGIKKLGVKAIALDGASELEVIIRSTEKWKQLCMASNGKHNGFAEPAATISLLRPILNNLRNLQSKLQIHFAISCILDVKEMGSDGAILEASPRLVGYSVAETVVQQFADVLVVGRMTRGDQSKHKIQMMSDVVKVSKDAMGTVKKTINFSPRITGVTVKTPILDADLSEIIKLKNGK